MNYAIMTQLQFFLISILWGAIILLAYDVLRILRRIMKHNELVLAVEDLIFWTAASLFIFAMIYHENDGIIRGFSVMGVTIGMVLFHYLFSEFFVYTITKFIQILLTPFNLAIRTIKRFLQFVFLTGKKAANYIIIRLKKIVKSYKINLDARKKAALIKKQAHQREKALKKKEQQEKALKKKEQQKKALKKKEQQKKALKKKEKQEKETAVKGKSTAGKTKSDKKPKGKNKKVTSGRNETGQKKSDKTTASRSGIEHQRKLK